MIRFDMMRSRPFRRRGLAIWNLYYVTFIVSTWNRRTTFQLIVSPWISLHIEVRRMFKVES